MISSSQPPVGSRARHDDPRVRPAARAPGRAACEQMLRSHTGWFTSPLVLFEAKAALIKVYGVEPTLATQKLVQVASGPVTFIDLAPVDVVAAFQLTDTLALDFTDAVLLRLAQNHGARFLATDDQVLSKICPQFGITPLSPLDDTLRQAVSAWETSHLPPKGLPGTLAGPRLDQPVRSSYC